MNFAQKMAVKRSFDVCVAAVGVVIFFVPMCVVAAAIWVVDGQLPVFAQRRVGQHGRLFVLYKFKTMRQTNDHSTITTRTDARITRLGGVLRRYKIDELPELFNILLGTMSFVGARPDVPGYADMLQGDDRQILLQKPGLTGIATLKYYNEEAILATQPDPKMYNDTVIYPDKLRLNLWYYHNFGLRLDVKIIIKTIFKTT
jgi:lipopolysaccharide/colanic/teichoic acid biosynthesis glycosyltransferase